MTQNRTENSWKSVQIHAAGHVIGAIIFALFALGFGLAIGGFVNPPCHCDPARVEYASR